MVTIATRACLIQEPVGSAATAVDPDPHLLQRSDVIDLQVEGVLLAPLKPHTHTHTHTHTSYAVVSANFTMIHLS